MKNILGKIFNCILNILLILIVICLMFAVYNFINLNVRGKHYTNYFGYTYFKILSGSMEEELKVVIMFLFPLQKI